MLKHTQQQRSFSESPHFIAVVVVVVVVARFANYTCHFSARGGSKEGFVRCRRRHADDVAGDAFVEVRTTLFVCLIEYYYYYYYYE